MLNCSLGTLLMLILAVICLVKGHSVTDMISKMPGLPDGILVFGACIAVCAAASMNDLTAPSVSLEGKNAVDSKIASSHIMADTQSQNKNACYTHDGSGDGAQCGFDGCGETFPDKWSDDAF